MAKVFYAWQSDRDQKVCHYFIRDAMKVALKKIIADAKDADIQEATRPQLDHDRKDVPGTPRIAETIEKKIRHAAVFVADLTAVTDFKTFDGRDKQTPNANVLIELGMAFRSVKSRRILLVMNTAFGRPEHLPFDLKDRSHPIQFDISGRSYPDYKSKLKTLADDLLEPLKLCLKHYEEALEAKSEGHRLTQQQQNLQAAEDHRLSLEGLLKKQKYRGIEGELTYAATFAPLDICPIDISDKSRYVSSFRPFLEAGSISHRSDTDSVFYEGMAKRHRDGRYTLVGVTEVFPNGFVFAAGDHEIERKDSRVGRQRYVIDLDAEPVDPADIDLPFIERQVIHTAQLYFQSYRKFGYTGSVAVGLSIFGIEGRGLSSLTGPALDGFKKCTLNEIISPFISVSLAEVSDDVEAVAAVLSPLFLRIWRHADFNSDPCFRTGRFYAGY